MLIEKYSGIDENGNAILIHTEEVELNMQSIPDWGAFNRGMILNNGYNRLASQTLNQRNVTRLETLLSPTGYTDGGLSPSDYPLLKSLWDEATSGLPLLGKPTNAEINSWNAIAHSNNMPFSFGQDGKMVLTGG